MITLHRNTPAITPTSTTPDVVADQPRREPRYRVVGGSLAIGLAGALALCFGAFPGAEEYLITGSALISFAVGWATLALLSSHFTSRAQRWAWVPAGFMATVATIMFFTRPGDAALNKAGWVWPLCFFPLAIWMLVRVRRGFSGRVRWLLYPVVGAIALASVGGMLETAVRAHDANAYPAPGELYDVGDYRLHLNCVGTGSPTVVLESGLGGTSAHWARITEAVGHDTRVCAYDRAGQGWSDDGNGPQDSIAIADDLHILLQRAGEVGPFVLVGHSAGGAYVMTYASRYPDEVAGMVLLDSMSPYNFTILPDFESEYTMMRMGLGVGPSFARLGIGQVVPKGFYSALPEPAASQVKAFSSNPRTIRNMRDDQSMYRTALPQAQALTSLGDKPLVVITATESLNKTKGWAAAQDQMAVLSTNSDHRIIESSHSGLLDEDGSYQASIEAISDVVIAVRSSGDVVGESSNNH